MLLLFVRFFLYPSLLLGGIFTTYKGSILSHLTINPTGGNVALDDKKNQQVPDHRIKAALLLNIAENIQWPNEQGINQFAILLIDTDTLLYGELKKIESNYLLKGKTIRVAHSVQLPKDPAQYAIIFLGEKENTFLNTIYQQVSHKGVLLFTDQGAERLLTMVNIVYNPQKKTVSFELNRATLEDNGFNFNPKLVAFGGNFIDIRELYLKTYQQLKDGKQKLQDLQLELENYKHEKKRYEEDIRFLNEKLKNIALELGASLREYDSLSKNFVIKDSALQATIKQLNKKNDERKTLQVLINKQLDSIAETQFQLNYLSDLVNEKQKELDFRKKEINEQGNLISEKESIILMQQKRFYLMMALLLGITLSLLFAFWAYRIKRRLNIELGQKVQQRTLELSMSRSHYQRLFDNSPIAMLELDLSQLLKFVSEIAITNETNKNESIDISIDKIKEGLQYIGVTNINVAGLKLFGFKDVEDARANYFKTYTVESLEMFKGVYMALIEKQTSNEYESIRGTIDGRKLYVILKWLVLPGYANDFTKVLLSVTDITKIKEYEQELTRHRNHLEELVEERALEILRLNDELKTSNEELKAKTDALEQTIQMLEDAQNQLIQQEKMASLGMLTAGIAHEINNPINYISGSQQALSSLLDEVWKLLNEYRNIAFSDDSKNRATAFELEKGNAAEEIFYSIKLLLSSIDTGIERTSQIIKSLRAFSRNDKLSEVNVYVPDALNDVLNILRANYAGRIQIVQQHDEHQPQIRCISNSIHQILMNLISNAIDAIEGEGLITISTIYHSITRELEIRIKDTGVGISPDIQSRIFDPFFTTKEVGKGTGLGLYITYNYIKANNGNIEVNSTPGEGSDFIVWLPVSNDNNY